MSDRPEKPISGLHWSAGILLMVILGVLTIWSWQKWDTVWVERSESFFPPEWQNEDLEALAWKYPVYRSNDTYQWVYLADSLANGNKEVLRHRSDEGLANGRPNAWSSSLAHLLNLTGKIHASIQDWPVERGIHASAHWLGSVLLLFTAGLGMYLVSRLAGAGAGGLFAALYFFNAAISWDFGFSRLDHESLFQLCFLLQVLGLAGTLQANNRTPKLWILLAGFGTAGCWWISSTVQVAVSVFSMLACLCVSGTNKEPKPKTAFALLVSGGVCALVIILACFIEQRSPMKPSLSSLHPIFAITQLGACAVCCASMLPRTMGKRLLFCAGLLAGMTPLFWIGIHQEAAHTWFDPTIRQVHAYIVEFQSPFLNGSWRTALFAHSTLTLTFLLLTSPWKHRIGRFFTIISLCLLVLALMQTRWLGLLASISTIGLCLSFPAKRQYFAIGIVAMLVWTFTWIWTWNRIETKPGRMFVTDMFLQIGARDLNLNLKRRADKTPSIVAIPYAFAATSALFDTVHPLGTFYWENRDGIEASARLFASQDDHDARLLVQEHQIKYLIVQGDQLGNPFVEMVAWTALEDKSENVQKASLAFRLSNVTNIPDWCEQVPFWGTFDPNRISMRIYRVRGTN
ncbi:MAG: hypothetical protein ACSHYA_00815 [Opitutaceae bacterium]